MKGAAWPSTRSLTATSRSTTGRRRTFIWQELPTYQTMLAFCAPPSVGRQLCPRVDPIVGNVRPTRRNGTPFLLYSECKIADINSTDAFHPDLVSLLLSCCRVLSIDCFSHFALPGGSFGASERDRRRYWPRTQMPWWRSPKENPALVEEHVRCHLAHKPNPAWNG